MAPASTCNKGLFIMAGPPSLPLVRWLAVLLQKRDVIGSETCHRTRTRRVPKTAGLRVCLPRSWQHHPARGWGHWPPVLWLQETLDVLILISSSLDIHAHDTESEHAARRWTSTSLSMGKISWKLRKHVSRKTDCSVDQRDGCFEGILTFGEDLEVSIYSLELERNRAPYCKTSFPDRYSVAASLFMRGNCAF